MIYAILSHTWRPEAEGGEQSYAEILEVQRRYAITPKPRLFPEAVHDIQVRDSTQLCSPPASHPYNLSNPHPIFSDDSSLSAKIRGVCQVARKAGYDFVWVDSGCIDKSSSAELAEAINSMFALYKYADVCYVYLADVSDGADAREMNSEFWRSRWHFRGWTLQELIAPKDVMFMDKNWRFFGTKYGLAATLNRITRIDFAILMGVASLDSVSVARRMSWAATRETTRVEDEAYSLLGIFGVNMSPIYGEGRNAFLRLQEEIIRSIPDQTIFVWGSRRLDMITPDQIRLEATVQGWSSSEDSEDGLLAPSPRSFRGTGNTVALTPTAFASRVQRFRPLNGKLPSLHCVFTPEGARISFLTIAQQSSPHWQGRLADQCRRHHFRDACQHRESIKFLALLPCEAQPEGSLIALVLLDSISEPRQNRCLLVTSTQMNHHPLCRSESTASRFMILWPSALKTMHLTTDIAEMVVLRSSAPVMILSQPPTPVRRFVTLWSTAATRSQRPGCDHQQGVPPPTSFRIPPWSEERLRAIGYGISPLKLRRPFLSSNEGLVLTATLTTIDTYAPVIQIKMTLMHNTWVKLTERTRIPPVHDTASCFSVIAAYSATPSTGSKDVGRRVWRTMSPYIMAGGKAVESHETHTSTGTFHSKRLEVNVHKRAIVEAAFLIDETDDGLRTAYYHRRHHQGRESWRRILRLSLECPREYCLDSASEFSSFVVPYLFLSIELSDIHIELEPDVDWSEPHIIQSEADSTNDLQCGMATLAGFERSTVSPGKPQAVSSGRFLNSTDGH